MQRIQETSIEISYHRTNAPHIIDTAAQKPLYEVFGDISEHLGFESYSNFQISFMSLCNRVIRDLGLIDVKNERTRDRWISSVKMARDVFNAENFGVQCGQVLATHFSESVRERIEDASERLQTLGRTEATKSELLDALEAARETLSAFEADGNLPREISQTLKHYLQQIEQAYQTYDDFGEDKFWSVYKELFATFVQTHSIITPENFSNEMKSSFNKMAGKMSYGLRAISITADIATIASAGVSLLIASGQLS